eukprot:scaffold8505_cov130-Cylindrotheca_fusiformis.AAC.15
MARSKLSTRRNEVKKAARKKPATKTPTKSKPSKLKDKANNKSKSRAVKGKYDSILNERVFSGKRPRDTKSKYGPTSGSKRASAKKRPRNSIGSKSDDSRKPFQLVMPKTDEKGHIPWWKSPTSAAPPAKDMKILKSVSVDSHSMWLLDQELLDFCKYVQLAPQETQVRDQLIQTIQEGAAERFGISESDIQVFGSYAALPVCTFESDIDLAVWGLVGNREPSSDTSNELDVAVRNEGANSSPKEPLPDHPNKRKQEKLLKWKAAIDEFEKYLDTDGTKESQESRAETKSVVVSVENTTSHEKLETASSLFVIDRIGAEDENAAPADDTAHDKSTTALADKMVELTGNDANGEKKSAVNAKASMEAQGRENSALGDNLTESDADGDRKPAAQEKANIDVQDGEITRQGDNMVDLTLSYPGSDNSDDDTADKLEGLKSRIAPQTTGGDSFVARQEMLSLPDAEGLAESSISPSTSIEGVSGIAEGWDDEEEAMIDTPKRRDRSHSLVSLSSATTCSDSQSLDETGMEVSFFNKPSRRFSASSHATKLSDDLRALINSKLNQLTKTIRRAGVATSIAVRKWARVPIINMITKYGFECDIAVGGHNGNDTSAYAATQIARYSSFAPVVILLKILLNQHDLDKPFTGGLGSFKLYVLVANHIERHLALGGSDSPAEILLMFFYRYGNISGTKGLPKTAETNLMRVHSVQCQDGGLVEMNHVFQIEHCVTVFKACWFRMKKLVERNVAKPSSFIRWIVHAKKLAERRMASIRTISGGLLSRPSWHFAASLATTEQNRTTPVSSSKNASKKKKRSKGPESGASSIGEKNSSSLQTGRNSQKNRKSVAHKKGQGGKKHTIGARSRKGPAFKKQN